MLMNHLRSKIIFLYAFLFFAIIPFSNLANAQIGNVGLPDTQSTIDSVFTPNQGTNIGSPNIESNPSSVFIDDSGEKYRPITPGGTSFFEGAGFETMVQKIFTLTIYFTVILSVLMIIYGGVEYMGSESVFTKGKGRERIQAALLGLFIALVSILLISTLVPGYQGNAFEVNIFGE